MKARPTYTLLALGSVCLAVQSAWAHDPIHRNVYFVSSRTKDSAPPWRRPSSRISSSPVRRSDYSSHFIEYGTAQSDRRSRLWSVNFKTRNVGKISWTSRIVWCVNQLCIPWLKEIHTSPISDPFRMPSHAFCRASVAAFCLQAIRPGFTNWGIKLSDRILQGRDMYRLVTPIFLHGGLLHLGTNMISLQRTGNDGEYGFIS
jgi:hypothetical protein